MSDVNRNCVVIGVFDGVHIGHRAMLNAAIEVAQKNSLPVTAVTFHPHPSTVVRATSPGMLCTIETREELLCKAGADEAHVIPFTRAFSQLSPQEFVEQWLVEKLRAAHVVVGDNFRFGYRAAGDVHMLSDICGAVGITVDVVDLRLGSDGEPVSSTRIRRLLDTDGDVAKASELLGRAYDLDAVIERGAGRGRGLGFATANMFVDPVRVIPLDGVYGGRSFVRDRWMKAAISVGTNPQFHEPGQQAPRTVEVHLPDHDGSDLYGEKMITEFITRIRGQRRFDTIDDLVSQIAADVRQVIEVDFQPTRPPWQ